MWQPLYDPPFVLPPKHAAVFRLAAATFSDFVGWEHWEADWGDMGIAVFDNLTQHQKQAAILIAAKALLDSACEPPDVTAVLAGTVDAIYIHLESSIELELGNETMVRQMILEAMDEMDYWKQVNSGLGPDEDPVTRQGPESEGMDEWNELIEAMRTEILDDYDFSMEHEFMDMPPEKEVLAAFELFWHDHSSSLNRIRNAIELLLTKIGVKRHGQKSGGGRSRLSLDSRIQVLRNKKPCLSGLCDQLLAVKHLGNAGNHLQPFDGRMPSTSPSLPTTCSTNVACRHGPSRTAATRFTDFWHKSRTPAYNSKR